MIRRKKEKHKYPDKIFAQRMKKLLEKTSYTSVNFRVFVSKSEFFCSCPLLAQTEFLNIALECKNLGDALLSATRI